MTRIAVIEKERCNPIGCGNYLCIRYCPVNREGTECIVVDTDQKIRIIEETCTGCGICVKKCPYDAIKIINLPDELTAKPVHRYGENGFVLYSLPTPLFGKVVGVLGRNGIGKSTAIKILAGIEKPNLGTLEPKSYDDLLDYFKGSEAQNYFEKLRDGKIKVAYKPQQVDLIPKQVRGKVRELLEKVDEKGEMDSVVDMLDLQHVLDTNIDSISGGELQRVAIAATVLKKANVYFFDEPTSYLDIKQRIRVSKFIKGLANEETAVMVIEHDLIILDYMTDLLHIMYGVEAAYGIVSHPHVTRKGMNVYLSGFLTDENIRFRDKPIKFEARPPKAMDISVNLVSWEGISKKLGNFLLNAPKGAIHKNTTVGVLGENGIGKTTFVKVLAGVSESDLGTIHGNVKVSYKPQYIENDSDELVMTYLHNALSREAELMNPLQLKPLLHRQLKQLSGGELQRVAIAKCISEHADVYLLDEPSAYLDVEQRWKVAKVIKDIAEKHHCSILVVDHDLLFASYLCDELLVCEGLPAKHGFIHGPFSMESGMNKFLEHLEITMRRDKESLRPRINKPESQLDREQRSAGKLFYG